MTQRRPASSSLGREFPSAFAANLGEGVSRAGTPCPSRVPEQIGVPSKTTNDIGNLSFWIVGIGFCSQKRETKRYTDSWLVLRCSLLTIRLDRPHILRADHGSNP